MGVCHEIDGPVTDVTWRDMTVLHYTYPSNSYEGIPSRGVDFCAIPQWVEQLGIFCSRISGSRIAQANDPLILIYNVKKPKEGTHFFPDKPYSPVSGVRFKRIRADNVANPQIMIMDQSGEGLVNDITFRDIVIDDRELVNEDPRFIIEGNVSGIRVRPPIACLSASHRHVGESLSRLAFQPSQSTPRETPLGRFDPGSKQMRIARLRAYSTPIPRLGETRPR